MHVIDPFLFLRPCFSLAKVAATSAGNLSMALLERSLSPVIQCSCGVTEGLKDSERFGFFIDFDLIFAFALSSP